jgi:hypothetical protein
LPRTGKDSESFLEEIIQANRERNLELKQGLIAGSGSTHEQIRTGKILQKNSKTSK